MFEGTGKNFKELIIRNGVNLLLGNWIDMKYLGNTQKIYGRINYKGFFS